MASPIREEQQQQPSPQASPLPLPPQTSPSPPDPPPASLPQPLPAPSTSSIPPATLDDAERLFQSGRAALREDDYDQAAECLSQALEIRARHYGELAPECALTYYKYGCALLYKVQAESDALNEPSSLKQRGEPSDSNGKEQDVCEANGEDEEGAEENLEDEDDSDLDHAWKMLDIARAIMEKQQCHSIEEVDVITALADVSLEREDFEMCFRDYTRALEILEGIVEPDNRCIAELCFKLSLAQQLGYKPKDALKYCQRAVSVCEARLQRLKTEVAIQKGTVDAKGKSTSPDNDSAEIIENGDQEQYIKGVAASVSQNTQTPSDEAKDEEEIREIRNLLEDMRDKVVELEQMASGPSILEAFKMANPAAVNVIKEVLSASTKLGDGDDKTVSSSHAGSSSSVFDAPSQSVPSASVTDLGVVGRGVKRATPVAVSSVANSNESFPKRRTLDEMMTGGVGATQIGFGTNTVTPIEGTSANNGNPLIPTCLQDTDGPAS